MSILQPESSIWYALCWIIVFARLASRRLHLRSWKRLQVDDYLIVLAMCTDTIVMALMQIIMRTSSNLLEPGEDVSKFSQKEIDDRIFGSKLVLAVEQMQIVTVWLVKACLLIMYYRMTLLLPQHKIVLLVAAYVAVGFVVMEILYLGVWCRPFSEYWALPPSNSQCSAATNHLIMNVVLNITSDLMIIAIPIPLLFRVKIPTKNKLILIGIFLVGTFTIVAAALNKYYSFTNPFGVEWTIWYLRESYTAILCANLPLVYPLIQRLFNLRNWSHNSYDVNRYGTYGARSRAGPLSAIKSNIPATRLRSLPDSHKDILRDNESQERINESAGPLKIYQNTQISVHSASAIEMGNLASPAIHASVETGSTSDEGSIRDKSSGEFRAA